MLTNKSTAIEDNFDARELVRCIRIAVLKEALRATGYANLKEFFGTLSNLCAYRYNSTLALLKHATKVHPWLRNWEKYQGLLQETKKKYVETLMIRHYSNLVKIYPFAPVKYCIDHCIVFLIWELTLFLLTFVFFFFLC